MTKQALEALNEKQLTYCRTMGVIIHRADALGLAHEEERARGKLRGFLECLCQMGIITGGGLRCLYLYFTSTEGKSNENIL